MLDDRPKDPLAVLIKATNIVDNQLVDQALLDAERLGIGVDRALVMAGHASETALRLAKQAADRVRAGNMSLNTGIRALRLAESEKIALDDAVRRLKDLHKTTTSVPTLTNELTRMMLKADVINDQHLGTAVTGARQTGMLTGRVLLLNKAVTVRILAATLNACLLRREKLVDDGDLIDGLKRAHKKDISLEQALFELGTFKQPVNYSLKLGDFMVMAGVVTESDLQECLELEITKNKTFTQVVKEQGLVSSERLETIIQLQGMVTGETIKPYTAASILRRVVKMDVPFYQALSEQQLIEKDSQEEGDLRVSDLLKLAGLIEASELESLGSLQSSNIKIGKILLSRGLTDERMLLKALRVQSLYKYGYLSRPHAVKILEETRPEEELDTTLTRMGIYMPTSMQWSWV